MKEIVIGLSWLDIIFVVFALSSFGWNIVQYVNDVK